MRIEVSQLPPTECSPNWRGFWAERYKAARTYRAAVFYECVDARIEPTLRGISFPFVKATLKLTLVFAEQRRRDRDNLLAMFKPGLDAIVAAGLVLDDDAEHLQISGVDILVDPDRAPLTIIELEEVKGERAG